MNHDVLLHTGLLVARKPTEARPDFEVLHPKKLAADKTEEGTGESPGRGAASMTM